MLSRILPIITQPTLYVSLAGFGTSLYVIWALARKQFLGTRTAMNLLLLALIAQWTGMTLVQVLRLHLQGHQFSIHWLIPHPQPFALLGGFLLLAWAATFYLRRVHYPVWRMLDMLALSLAVFDAWLELGWLIRRPGWVSLATLAATVLIGVGLWLVYRHFRRTGVVVCLYVIAMFGIAGVVRHQAPSWQVGVSGVEWWVDWFGLATGLALLPFRLWERSRQMVLQDLPRGVSQGFRDTFGRMITSRKPSS